MSRPREIDLGFSPQDTEKAVGVLSKFMTHVTPENVVIVGGIARRFHLMRHGVSFPQRPFNDLDFMVKDRQEVRPTIITDFMIAHYHPPRGTSFFAGLVEPHTKVTIDVFDYFHAPIDPDQVRLAGYDLKIRSAEDQLTKAAYDLMKITKGHTLSPKEFDSADQLMEVVDLTRTEEIWNMKYKGLYPFPLTEAIKKAKDERDQHPERVFENPIRTTEPYNCGECVDGLNHPLTPKAKIIKVLGYIDKP